MKGGDPVIADPRNGKLSTETAFNINGDIATKKVYGYLSSESKHYYGVKLVNNFHIGAELINPAHGYWQTHYYASGRYRYYPNCFEVFTYALNQNDVWLASMTETTDGVVKKTSYTVDRESMLVSRESFTDSDGQVISTQYKYPKDFSHPVYTTLCSKHIISPVVETRVTRGGSLIFSRLNTFDVNGKPEAVYYSSLSSGTSLSTPAFSGTVPNSALYPVAATKVLLKDSRGNPLEFSLGGIENEIYIWGYNYRYPVAKVKGATRQQVENAIGSSLQSLSANPVGNPNAISSLCTNLPHAQVESYTYSPLGNILGYTDAAGTISVYIYDTYGRLTTKRRLGATGFEDTDSFTYTDTSITHRTFYSSTNSVQDICYYNGLGLPEQTVQVAPSQEQNSIVQPFFYDHALRESRKYLPFELSGPSSARQTGIFAKSQTQWGDNYPYTQTEFENAPTDRVSAVIKPGAVYRGSSAHKAITGYRSNAAGEVRKLSSDDSGNIVSNGYYAANLLNVVVSTDEDGAKKAVFTNRMGLLVLERSYMSESSHADTYYVYDRFYNLAYVITPEGSATLANSSTYGKTSSLVADFCYRYEYDARRRMTLSQMPGGKCNHIRYDDLDRQILLRDNVSWQSFSYDASGRLSQHRQFSVPVPESYILSNPQSFANAGTVNEQFFYDSYPTTDIDLAFAAVSGVVSASDVRTNTKGLKTQENICDVSTSLSSSPSYAKRRFFYDRFGRVIQSVEKATSGDIVRTSYAYDYRGNVTTLVESARDITKKQVYTYDPRDRQLSENVYMNNSSAGNVSYTYDILNRPTGISFGVLIRETRTYTLQGWLESIDVKRGILTLLFNQQLRYTDVHGGAAAKFNGNVSSMTWSIKGQSTPNTYAFSYDSMNRLTGAEHLVGSSISNSFTEKDIAYDRNGNITALKRYISGALADNFDFQYTGNKRNGYTYDSRGNITHRAGDDYTTTYNRLSLPQSVTKTSGQSYTYGYLADGTKTSEIGSDGYGYRYLGTMRFRITPTGEVFDSTPFGHGRIVRNQSTGALSTQYHITDHLGSTRFVTNSSGSQTAAYNYTPFGVMQEVGTGSNSTDYTFSGKEKQLYGNILDFGARLYDPRTAIWNAIDPKAEKYFSISPYAYCNNNPVIFVDPDGKVARVAIGAVTGALFEMTIAILQEKSLEEVGVAAVVGAIEGGIGAATFGLGGPATEFIGAILKGVIGGAAGSAFEQIATDGEVDLDKLSKDAAWGAVFGGISKIAGDFTKEITFDALFKRIDKTSIWNSIKRDLRSTGLSTSHKRLSKEVKSMIEAEVDAAKDVSEAAEVRASTKLSLLLEELKKYCDSL